MSNDPRGPYKRRVVCAANLYKVNGEDFIILGARHFDLTMHATLAALNMRTDEFRGKEVQGFIDQHGVFLTRQEAFIIAKTSKQFVDGEYEYQPGTLYSENLY